MADVLVPLLWVPILGYVAWAWAGRSPRARSWASDPLMDGVALGAAPGGGLLLFSVWLYNTFGDVMTLVAALLWLFSFPVTIIGLFAPRWWGPRWWRQMTDEERMNKNKPINAAGIAMAAGPGPGTSANKASRAFGSFAKRVGSWRGGYVYDPDTRQQAHGAARWGTVDGKVTVYLEGLTFAATKAEDLLRDQETLIVIPAEQITGVRTVPPRAGADGVPRKGFWYRSKSPRLVVDAGDGSYLFDIGWRRAKQVAQQISRITGRVS